MKPISLVFVLCLTAGCQGESTQTVSDDTSITCTRTQSDIIVKKLSRQLSPQAKKALLRAKPGDWIKGTLLLDAGASPQDVQETLSDLGAKPGAWSDTTRQMSVEIPVDCLESVVDLPQVMYFEAASTYSISTDED